MRKGSRSWWNWIRRRKCISKGGCLPQRHSPRDEIKWTVQERERGGFWHLLIYCHHRSISFPQSLRQLVHGQTLSKWLQIELKQILAVLFTTRLGANWKMIAEHLIGLKTASLSFLNPFTFFCHYHKLSDLPQCQEVTLGRSTIRCTEWKWKKMLKITSWAEKIKCGNPNG